ncbi:MAG TPA: TlpA disulfide reductase family protein [Polyangiaceae bacterium]|nr:TlpA disulfide reductase family protein [Polyangiaceae bacterium]
MGSPLETTFLRPFVAAARARWLPLALPLTLACGSGTPDIPEELLATEPTASPSTYPPGPYLSEVGSTLENFSFSGWRDPVAAGFDPSALEVIRMSDFYDPAGARGLELLLVNTAAIWCQACRVEHRTLPERRAELRARGFEVLSGLFQDASADPADIQDLQTWVEQFEIDFPMVLDPEFQLGKYGSAEAAPINLLVDVRSMRIIERFVGDQEAVMWPLIESELERRSAP